MRNITLIEGDGIGPEISKAVVKIFRAANVPVVWEIENAGQTTLETKGELIPDSLIASINKNKIALKGPITTPVGKGFKSINVQLRQMFDLYQNVRPCKSSKGIQTKFENVNLVLFRENTEGLYSGLEFYDDRLGISDSIARITKTGCFRINKAAFEFAKKNGKKKVTVVHKANILKIGGKLFLDMAQVAHQEFPEVAMEDRIIDNMCMQLVAKPHEYEVLVTTNLFGDILSDLCAGLVGGLGVVAGANIGDEVAIFEAVHGSAPDIAGKGVANPSAMLRSGIMMLHYIGLHEHATQIENALEKTFMTKEHCTRDLGGSAGTEEFTNYVINNLN